jgi:hypothetical protein
MPLEGVRAFGRFYFLVEKISAARRFHSPGGFIFGGK